MKRIFDFGLYFSVDEEKPMSNDRDQDKNIGQQKEQKQQHRERHRSSAFKETSRGDEKSTKNIEEEAHLEQERKEAMTERD